MTSDSKHFLSGRKVIVAGAGIAGLSFVISLFKDWDSTIPPPEVVVVDADGRDESINRWPYHIQLNGEDADSPLVGLQSWGLLDTVQSKATKLANPDATMHVWDKTWKPLLTMHPKKHDGLPTSSVRLSRSNLLTILIEAAGAHTKIHWSTSVQNIERLSSGQWSVSLLDKASSATSQQECDLLIAADGDESTIRKILRPKDVSKNTGHIALGGLVEFGSKEAIPAPLTNDFGIVVSGDGAAAAVTHFNNDGSLIWTLIKPEKEPYPEYNKKDATEFEGLMKDARTWSKNVEEPLNTFIDKTLQENSFKRPVREREAFTHSSADLKGVIFIGEANRLISTYLSNGGALAIRDGIELAAALVSSESLDAATAKYDKTAIVRANKSTKQSRETMTTAHLSGWKWTVAKTALAAGGYLSGK